MKAKAMASLLVGVVLAILAWTALFITSDTDLKIMLGVFSVFCIQAAYRSACAMIKVQVVQ